MKKYIKMLSFFIIPIQSVFVKPTEKQCLKKEPAVFFLQIPCSFFRMFIGISRNAREDFFGQFIKLFGHSLFFA